MRLIDAGCLMLAKDGVEAMTAYRRIACLTPDGVVLLWPRGQGIPFHSENPGVNGKRHVGFLKYRRQYDRRRAQAKGLS
jgi:hypothetical protein